MSAYAVNDLDRRLANLLRIGTIAEVSTSTKLARVTIGDITTDWLPWLVKRAGNNVKTWWAPDVGEQVIVFSPGGELGQGVIGGSLFQSETSGFEANGSELENDRIEVGDALFELSNSLVKLRSASGGVVEIGNSPTSFAALATAVETELGKIATAFTSFSPGSGGATFATPYTSVTSVAAAEVKVK